MIKYSRETLLPYIPTAKLEEAATEFLEKYCPEALVTPMPIPIEDIIENKMGLNIIYRNKITKDNSIFGLITFKDGILPLYDQDNDEYIDCLLGARSIIVDTSSNNAGQINNTLAHEAVHYNYHRKYFLYSHGDSMALKCDAHADIEDRNLKLIEWQATNIAPKILMPKDMVTLKANELFSHKCVVSFGGVEFDWTVNNVIDEIAEFFHVSRTSAYYRLKGLGYDVSDFDNSARQIYAYYKDSNIKQLKDSKISLLRAFELYSEDEDFQKTLDSGLFKYENEEFVLEREEENTVLQFCRASKTMTSGTAFFKSTANNSKETFYHDEQVDLAIKLYKKDVECITKREPTFNEQVREILNDQKADYGDFYNITGLSRNIYSQINNEVDSHFTLNIAMAIIVGLQVDIDKSLHLLGKAGYTLNNSRLDMAYRMILNVHLTIDEANSFLEELGFDKIGARPRR